MSSSNHDIIIIGAGIAGLYSAYNIKKNVTKYNISYFRTK
jgi:monoamine oxidase